MLIRTTLRWPSETAAATNGLAGKLMAAGKEENGCFVRATRFFLKHGILQPVSGWGIGTTLLAAIDELDSGFQIDALKQKETSNQDIEHGSRGSDYGQKMDLARRDRRHYCRGRGGGSLRYGRIVGRKLPAAVVAHAAEDPNMVRDATTRIQEVRAGETAYAVAKAAVVVLAKNPTDADANLKLGKYHCFYKGDWAGGLPMLVRREVMPR